MVRTRGSEVAAKRQTRSMTKANPNAALKSVIPTKPRGKWSALRRVFSRYPGYYSGGVSYYPDPVAPCETVICCRSDVRKELEAGVDIDDVLLDKKLRMTITIRYHHIQDTTSAEIYNYETGYFVKRLYGGFRMPYDDDIMEFIRRNGLGVGLGAGLGSVKVKLLTRDEARIASIASLKYDYSYQWCPSRTTMFYDSKPYLHDETFQKWITRIIEKEVPSPTPRNSFEDNSNIKFKYHGFKNQTPLMVAAERGNTAIVDHLLKAKANVNDRDERSETALMIAANRGYYDIVLLLLQAGADTDVRDRATSSTALMFAVLHNYVDIVRVLVEEFGADLNIRDNNNRTALMKAEQRGGINKEILDILKNN